MKSMRTYCHNSNSGHVWLSRGESGCAGGMHRFHRVPGWIAYCVWCFELASIGCTIFSRQSKHTDYSGALRYLDKAMYRVMNVWVYMDILDVKVGALSLYIFMGSPVIASIRGLSGCLVKRSMKAKACLNCLEQLNDEDR